MTPLHPLTSTILFIVAFIGGFASGFYEARHRYARRLQPWRRPRRHHLKIVK